MSYTMETYMNTNLTPRQRAQALLAQLSMEEKIAQLGCVFPRGIGDLEAMEASKWGIGQVSCLEMRMLKTPEDVADFQREYQEQIMNMSPHHIPAVFHMEGLCGPLFQGTTSFPAGISRGSGFDPALERKIGEIVGRQERSVGITQTLAPVLDISRDARLGRQCETYGEDPALSAALGSAYTAGVQSGEVDGRHTDACAKHFLGFHQSAGGIHGTHVDVPQRTLRETYAKPFQAAITEAGLKGVMPCYCSIDGIPLHINEEILTGMLRDEMGFEGVVLSDYCAVGNVHRVQHATESMTHAGALALEAGLDVELQIPECINQELTSWVKDGCLDVRYVDRAVLRVLEAKFRMGLFEHPFALTDEELNAQLHNSEDREITLQAARQSLVLLKNEGALPISKGVNKIAVIGPHARNARFFFGGYTHLSMAEATMAAGASMAGVEPKPWQTGSYIPYSGTPIQPDNEKKFHDILRLQKPDCRNLLEQLQLDLPGVQITYAYGCPIAGDDMTDHEEALQIATEADLIIMTVGGKNGSGSIATTGEGVDASTIGLPACQEVLIEKLAALGKPLVGLHFDGRPISSDVADKYFNAILECWSPGEMGAQAISEVLRGVYNPSGKLPVTVAYHAGQLPLYYNHPYGSMWHQGESIGFQNYVDLPHTPRYYFGHGLSYTTFVYSDLQVEKAVLDPEETLNISCKIKNTGTLAGTEIVQFYFRDCFASMTRPVQELAGFARVQLRPGEEKRVRFTMKLSQTAFLDRNMRWKVEKGDMDILVGASSQDIRLTGRFTVSEDAFVDGRTRGFYADTTIE